MSRTRRIPTQSRSREKVDQIIESARELIGSKGNDSVSMREIAKHSGVALASIYQYFPDKNAILQAIMSRFFDQVRDTIEPTLDDCNTIEQLNVRMRQGLDGFYSRFKNDPVLAILWAGLQANPKLMALDAQDSKRNAEIFSLKVCSIVGNQNQTKVYDATLLIVHMIGSTIRLALTLPEPEGERLIAEFKELVELRLRSL